MIKRFLSACKGFVSIMKGTNIRMDQFLAEAIALRDKHCPGNYLHISYSIVDFKGKTTICFKMYTEFFGHIEGETIEDVLYKYERIAGVKTSGKPQGIL